MISLSLLTDNQYTRRQALETQKKETLLVSNTSILTEQINMIFLCFIMGIFNQMEGKSIGKILKK